MRILHAPLYDFQDTDPNFPKERLCGYCRLFIALQEPVTYRGRLTFHQSCAHRVRLKTNDH